MGENKATKLTSANYANGIVENNKALISKPYSDGKGEWEKSSSEIITKVGRALIPRVHLREDPFVFTCLLKWKFKCELKNGMLCLRSRPPSFLPKSSIGERATCH